MSEESLLCTIDVFSRVVVLFGTSSLPPINTRNSESSRVQLRAVWVLLSIANEDEETQRKGHVVVSCNMGGTHLPNRKLLLEFGRVNRAFPLRLASHHACLEDPLIEAAMNFSALLTGPSVTVRHRCHRGSAMEVQYKLMTFGIPGHLYPTDPRTGEFDLSYHKEFIRKRWIQESSVPTSTATAMEEESPRASTGTSVADGVDPSCSPMEMVPPPPPSPTGDDEGLVESPTSSSPSLGFERSGASSPVQIVVIPTKLDICFGRGKGIMKYPGNLRFRKVIEERLESYDDAQTKGEKSDIIREVVVELSSSGSRFLKQDEMGQVWTTVGFKESCAKVSHVFRNQKRSTRLSTR
jgi:hypothetical protein